MVIRPRTLASGLLAAAALLSTAGCASRDLHVAGAPAAPTFLESFDRKETGVALGGMRLKPSVCRGMDLRPDFRRLDVDDFAQFLQEQGLQTSLVRARNDLVFVDVLGTKTPKSPLRFRVAILGEPDKAGHELHRSLLEHGEGRWGVHRANLAVLAPDGALDDVVVFASTYKLACWGVLTVAGLNDNYVVPGGYDEP